MLVTKLKAGLPVEFLNCLPKTCPYCNAPTEITEGLTALSCSNPLCKSKLTERMVAMLADLGVKNLGSSKCQSFIEAYNIASPYALFEFAQRDGTAKNVLYQGCSKEFSDSIAEQINSKRSKLLWEYVKIGNFPGIRDSANKLFHSYTNIENFYDDLEDEATGGVLFIQKLLGISTEASVLSVKATEIYNTLCSVKAELCYYQKFFDIQETGKAISICISTGVGEPYTSKADFVDKMNKSYGTDIHINQLSSVTKQCDVLVWSKKGAPTSKVQKAGKLGIAILTGKAFNIVLKLYVEGFDMKEVIKAVEEAEDNGASDIEVEIREKLGTT